jgi:hypothetical protein
MYDVKIRNVNLKLKNITFHYEFTIIILVR